MALVALVLLFRVQKMKDGIILAESVFDIIFFYKTMCGVARLIGNEPPFLTYPLNQLSQTSPGKPLSLTLTPSFRLEGQTC